MLPVIGDQQPLHQDALADHLGEVARAAGLAVAVVLLDEAAQHDAPVHHQVVEGGIQHGAPHVLEVDVDAFGGEAGQLGVEIRGLPVVDHRIGTQGLEVGDLVGRAGGADDPGPRLLGELDRHGADRSGGRRDQQGFTGLQVCHLVQARPGGHARHAEGAEEALGRQGGVGQAGELGGVCHEGIPPAQHAAHLVPHLEIWMARCLYRADGAAV